MIAIEKAKCKGCHVCTWVCPHGALSMDPDIVKIAHQERCIECGACELNCTSGAIKVTKGTGCLLVIIKEDILGLKGESSGCG